jgi:SAM-dependent methyltransferase
MSNAATPRDFAAVYGSTRGNDDFYRFLQNVYRLYPEDRFHLLIRDAARERGSDDAAIYRDLQRQLPAIKPFLADLFYALPSLAKQKREMTRQTLELLGTRREFDGYIEIGSTGRYLSHLRKALALRGDRVLVNDLAPTNSPVDIVERGGLRQHARFVPLDDYAPLPPTQLADGAFDLVTCYIGLHHSPLDRLDAFIASIRRVMRPGGLFVLRDHDVADDYMNAIASLAHTVFNAGLNTPWETNLRELRHFRPIAQWIELLGRHGLVQTGPTLLQPHDPTLNTLLAFERK